MKRKIALIILIAMIVSMMPVFSVNVYAEPKVGDVMGNVLHTNIKTFIDGVRIPSYNINNKSAVILNDLKNYGFDVVYDNDTRTSSVTHNPNKPFDPETQFDENSQPSGTVAFQYVYTNIVAKVNGKQVESFNIRGNLAIFFEDLKDYGTFSYVNATRESNFMSYKPGPTVAPTTEKPVEPPTITITEKPTEPPTIAPTTEKITETPNETQKPYVITETGKKYHYPNCSTVKKIKQYVTKEEAIKMGYEACKVCKPN